MSDNENSVPRSCYVPLQVELEAGIVKFGESGYYKTTWGQVADSQDDLQAFVDTRNERLGITKAQAQAMHDCSMFDCWQNYEELVETWQTVYDKKEQEEA